MSEQQAESASKSANADDNDATEGSAANDSTGSKSAAKSQEGSVAKSKEGSAASSKEGSSAKSQEGSADKSKEGSSAKSQGSSTAKSKEGSAANSKEGSSAKSQEGSAAKSAEASNAKSMSGENSAADSSQASKDAHKSKSKESAKKSKEKSKSKDKSKSKEKPKSKEKSKSKDKSKSQEKPKSKEKSKSNQKSKSTSKQVAKSKSSKSKSKQGSSDMKMSKKRSIDLAGAKIGFVGAGKMTTAIVRGLTNFAQVKPKRIFVAAKTTRNLDQFKSLGVNVSTRAYDIFGQFDCDIVFLCMHGFVIRACFKGGGTRPLAFTVNYIPNQKHPLYVLSLIGGVSLEDIKLTLLDPEHPDKYMLSMHRVMLNIGIGYGLGMAVLDVEVDSNNCSPVVRDLLSALIQDKHVEHLPEQMMDTACIIGGNGLAFCYYFISAVADGGFKMGLNKVMSVRLAAKSLQIAAQSVIETGKHPSELRDSVTSQGGPAIYGINSLDKVDCAGGFQSAIEGAFRRLKELVNIEPVTETEAKPF